MNESRKLGEIRIPVSASITVGDRVVALATKYLTVEIVTSKS